MKKHLHLSHKPVLEAETVNYLITDRSGIYVDCTLGAGGHAAAILRTLNAKGWLVGIDRDERAIANFQRLSSQWPSRVSLFHSRFSLLGDLLPANDVYQVDGVLFDLGLASFQIDDPERGFSYLQDGPLDMRMDSSQLITARMVVNEYGEEDLAGVIRNHGQERHWRRMARAITRARERMPIETTAQLAEIVRGTVPYSQAIKSLSRVFQAIRIEVNQELDELHAALEASVELLKAGGRLVVLCYQSLEDRAVKEVFARFSGICRCPKELPQCVCGSRRMLHLLTKRAVQPTVEEIRDNPRARSARLRAAQKIGPS